MAFFQLILKAQKLERARLNYEDEKLRSIEISGDVEPRLTLKQRLRRKRLRCRKRMKYLWSRIISPVKHTWVYKKARLLRMDGTLENYILKSLFGFLGGTSLTYIFFVFFVFQLNFSLWSATLLCSLLGVILTLGLAFSYRVRCIVFLLLPQFFSKRGRQAVMAYAFILTLTGPGKNTLHNISVLSESLACEQEQLKQAVKTVVDLIKEPFNALRDAISKVIRTVKVVVKKIKRTLMAIKRLVLSILRVITSVFQWLGSIVNICNKKLGTPFDRCQGVFEGAVADCKAKLGPLFGGICNLTYIVGALCYVVKPLDFICMLVSYVADTIVDAVRNKIKRFTRHVKAMFYVKVKFSHSFHFETNQSKTMGDVSANIIAEVRSRTDRFLTVFDWMSFMAAFFIFFMLLRIMYYRHKWLTNERFDNRYLTDDLRTIDLIRTRQDKETILPLNHRERNQYIPLTSVTLIKAERVKLAKSVIFLTLTMFKIGIHMMADYSLYWILSIIRYHGRVETKVQRPNFVGVHVSGDGYLADLYRSIVRAFTPHAKDIEIDMLPCLPDPVPPDLDRYTQIATLIAFCWIMTIFEPYGLRLRQVVMCNYHPERAKQRAAWLYNHIIRSRGSFLKFARRQLRRKFGMVEGERIERVTFRERCLAICPFLNKLFPQKQNVCLLCGAVERSDREPHIKCATLGCVGLFCIQCFADLQNLCTICRSPIEYGDLSDISEEKDSSDDQLIARKEPVPIVYEEEEPVAEAEPKEEIMEKEGKPEERISAERIPEAIIPQERMPEEKIPAEEEEEEEEEKIVERKDKAVQTDAESSSESIYSYTYQEESSREIEIERYKAPFKDIEAQKIREDVTIQIFNDPLAKEITSSSEDPTSCFMVRARRRLRTRLKRKSCSSPRKDDSSTSIADTESWPTEELDEEEVIHIEVDDGSEELLLKDGADKEKKRSRVKGILAALARIPWLGKRTTDSERRTRKPSSLIDKIARLLPGNRSASPVSRTYRRIRTMRKDTKREKPSSASSTSSTDEEDEERALLKTHDRQVDCLQIISDHDDSGDNIYSRNYDSHRARRGTICHQPDPRARVDDATLRHPREKEFATRALPRYLQPISNDTAYFEVDEIKDSRSKRRCVRVGDRINILSDTRTSVDSQRTDNQWNTSDGHIPCSSTSQISSDIKENSKVCQLDVTKRSDEVSKTDETSETDGELSTVEVKRSDKGKKMGKIVIPIRTRTDTDRQEVSEKILIKDYKEKSIMESDRAIEELNNMEENLAKKYFVETEQPKKLEAGRKTEASTSRANDEVELYDPLVDSRLYGVTYRAKGRERPAKEKLTKQAEVVETRIDDRNAAESTEFEEGTEMMQKNTQIVEHEIRKFAKMPEKGTQTNLRNSDEGTGAVISKAVNSEKGRKKKAETRWQKWIDKRKRRKESQLDSSSSRKRKSCDKATLIKEKQYSRRRKREMTCGRDVQTHERTRRTEDFSCTSRVEWCPDDVRRQRKVTALFRPITKLSENRRIQCNLRDEGDVRGKQDDVCGLKFTNEPEIWSCNIQPRFDAPEQTIHRRDHNYWKFSSPRNEHVASVPYRRYEETKAATKVSRHLPNVRSSQLAQMSPVEGQPQQMRRRRYDVNVHETRPEMPMLKKYLPAYQAPGLIEELKEHDRIRLIQEREVRRWTALNALRSTRDSPLSAESTDRTSFISVTHESIGKLTSASTKLNEGNNLPYQETQIFKDVVCEFRKKIMEVEKPLISLSRRADECKDLKQLFPPQDKDYERVTTMPKFDEAVNRRKIQLMYNERDECCKIHETKHRFENESFSELSSICNCPCEHHRSFPTSTSTDETTDTNHDIDKFYRTQS